MRSLWLLGLLAAIAVSAAQEANPSASPTDARPSETETLITADPPYYSLKQLKQWIEREKQQAKARVKALEESGAPLDPAKRHKLEEGPEYLYQSPSQSLLITRQTLQRLPYPVPTH
jgi:biotin operon repressor